MKIGTDVSVHGLLTSTKYNGHSGTIISYAQKNNRWEVQLFDGGACIFVKQENLTDLASCAKVRIFFCENVENI